MTDLFPIQYSTLSAKALGRFVAQRYGLKDATCSFLMRGVSDTYRIDTKAGTQYILKVYRRTHRPLSEIKGEVELLDILHQQDAKVSFALKDKHGEKIQEFKAPEGIRHGILFTYAPGKTVRHLSNEQVQIVGREMAYNHNITSQIQLMYPRPTYDIYTTLLSPVQALEPAFATYPEGYKYLRELSDRVICKMAGFDARFWNYGYCHYDYLPKNFHFDEHDRFTLFDFDFAGKGPLVNDLMSFQVHFFLHIVHSFLTQREASRQWDLFLKAYQSGADISDEEIAAIPYLGLMFWTFFLRYQYEHYDDWSNNFFNDSHLQRMVAWLKRWEELYCDF
ncbi:MAG: phosphotransferase [Bacteroidota bacterium]